MPRLITVLACAGFSSSPFNLAHSLFEHGGVHLKADGFDVTGTCSPPSMLPAPRSSRVERGDLEACSEVGELLERGQTTAGNLG